MIAAPLAARTGSSALQPSGIHATSDLAERDLARVALETIASRTAVKPPAGFRQEQNRHVHIAPYRRAAAN
jgi:hypothetical protein